MNGMTPAKKLGATIGATAALTMLLAGGAMAAEDHLGNTDCRAPTAADDAQPQVQQMQPHLLQLPTS